MYGRCHGISVSALSCMLLRGVRARTAQWRSKGDGGPLSPFLPHRTNLEEMRTHTYEHCSRLGCVNTSWPSGWLLDIAPDGGAGVGVASTSRLNFHWP